MIKIIFSNKTERLLRELSKGIRERRERGTHPLEPVRVVVPNRNMETWTRLGLAQLTGVAANLRFSWLNRFLEDLVAGACPGELKLVDLDTAEAALLAVLMDEDLMQIPELRPVKGYLNRTMGGGTVPINSGFDAHLGPDGVDLRRVQLAARMAFLFQEYSLSRPEMIAAWRGTGNRGDSGAGVLPFADPVAFNSSVAGTVTWQRALWRAVFGRSGILEQNPPAEGGRWVTMDLLPFEESLFKKIKAAGLPPIHIFGISYMARIFQHLLARLGEITDLIIYALNPCAEYWEDVETLRGYYLRLDRELERQARLFRLGEGKGEREDLARDPFGLYTRDNPALLYWGRPGSEYMRLLGELTECDFTDAFENPLEEGGGLLQRLQLDILLRNQEEQGPGGGSAEVQSGDETIRLVAAPSVRREVEWVADEIWRLVEEERGPLGGPPLRFSDMAIIVNNTERDRYLPMIEAVFAAAHDLPCSISDLPGSSGSRLIEAMNLLLKLPFGRFSRSEMLALMGHPAILDGFDELTAEDLAAIAERLGIIFGADHQDHRGTYIDEDIYNWDQGLRRLALGVFMTGEKSGDSRIYESNKGRWLVEEALGSSSTAARFGLLARSLLSDARFVREKKMTLTNWSKFYLSQVDCYFHEEAGEGGADRLLLRRALARLEAMDLGQEVSGKVAAEIAGRTLESLTGSRGQYLAEGVAVSTFMPMRAIPFRVIFLLGLGEGLFPASAQRDALDLRSVRRREGDVDPSERDRYMFLETLLCTRERLYLSYVNRDEHTGDVRQPSAVVQELLHILESDYLGSDGIRRIELAPPLPLRRYDEQFERRDTFLDEARAEAQVQELAREWHARTGPEERGHPAAKVLTRHLDNREQRDRLLNMLGFPGEPPVTAAVRFTGNGEEEILEAPVSISLPVIRRFLECPMQGWASALLGLTEVEEDFSDREEEDFEINRLVEINLLNDIFYRLEAGERGSSLEDIYKHELTRLILAGRAPAGKFGKVMQKRHLQILRGWQTLLEQLKSEGSFAPNLTSDSSGLHRICLGHSSRPAVGGAVLDPLLLEVLLREPGGERRTVPVRVSGLTEGLAANRLLTVSLQARKPPKGAGMQTWVGNFRYFLRGAITDAVLTATGTAGEGERQSVILFAGGDNEPGGLRLRLEPFSREEARSWLTGLVADLLAGPHAYLLPCDAVFREYWERKGEGAVDGAQLAALTIRMAENEWLSFSSLWGPVPSPRLYEPPSAGRAAEMVTRRFEPFFSRIISREVF